MIKLEFARRIYLSFILLLICASVIAFAGIRGFQRLAPAINTINVKNTQSLYFSEKMITNILAHKNIEVFEDYLNKSKQNITEPNEKELIHKIEKSYKAAFEGNKLAEEETIDYIVALTNVNRAAMQEAGIKAKRLENVGICIIIFPTIFAWIIGLALLNSIDKKFIKPVLELHDVVASYRAGNKMRRCPKVSQSEEFQEIYNDINAILDRF